MKLLRKFAWRRSLPRQALVLCLFLLCTQVTMAAEGPPAIQFAADAPLSAVWPDGKIMFAVQNNTTADLILDVGVAEFAHGAQIIEASELLQTTTLTITLPAAGSAWVSLPLAVKPAFSPEPGAYASFVAVASPTHGLVIRRPLTLTVANPQAAAAGLKPGVAAYTIQAYRLCPFAPPWCVNNCALPLKDLPAPASLPTGTLGYLTSAQGGALSVTLARDTPSEGAQLAYDFSSGWGLAGAYTGKVDLAPSDEAQGDVTLTVNVTDAIWYPILLLIIGVFITAWTQNWLGVRRPLWQLVRREATASKVVAGWKPVSGYDIRADALRLLTEVKQEAQALDGVWMNLLFAPGEAEAARQRHAKLEAKLTSVEDQLAFWPAAWETKLNALQAALKDKVQPALAVATPPPALPVPLEKPQFYTAAAALCSGQPVTLANFTKQAAAVDKAITLATQWGAWEQALAWTRTQLDSLQNLTPDEAKVAARARQQANSAWIDLWIAADLDDLHTRRTEAEISAAVDGASRLLHRLPRTKEPGDSTPNTRDVPPGDEPRAVLPFLPVADLPAEPAARAQRAENALRLGDRAFLGIAVLVALATGLSQLYFGKNFGSLDDWLKALTWGAGSKLGVDLVKTAMDRFFVRA
jgi:hypothetical protein